MANWAKVKTLHQEAEYEQKKKEEEDVAVWIEQAATNNCQYPGVGFQTYLWGLLIL